MPNANRKKAPVVTLKDRNRGPIEATQQAVDAVPLDGPDRRVLGVPGLYLRPCKTVRSFYVQRKQPGQHHPTKVNIGPVPLKQAKNDALRIYADLGNEKPLSSSDESTTFSSAFEHYKELKDGKLRPRTIKEYDYYFSTYLPPLHTWTLERLGSDEGRREVQRQHSRIRKQHGKAAANQAMRLISAVYNKACRTDSTLPQRSPTVATELDAIEPRNSALDDIALRAWGKEVQTLTPVKRMWWLTCLLTGARQSSVNMMKWADVDLDRKIIKFWKSKRKSYVVPAGDILCKLLADYKASAIPSPWIFPSPVIGDQPLQHVREKPKQKGEGPRIKGPQSLRHTHKTRGYGIISQEMSKFLLGHGATGRDVNYDYATLSLIVEPARPASNWIADQYAKLLPDLLK